MNNDSKDLNKEKINEVVSALDDFVSTMNELSRTQQAIVDETNRQLELEKVEILRKQINKKK